MSSSSSHWRQFLNSGIQYRLMCKQMKTVLLILFLNYFSLPSSLGIYLGDRDNFADLLQERYGLDQNEAAIWSCTAYHRSNYSTNKKVEYASGDVAYGIFQITNAWCADSPTDDSNQCNIDCKKFLDSNLRDDLKCARKIRNTAW